jgi:Zn-dependent protease with chaperone function
MKFITGSLLILVLLYGLVFAIADLYLANAGAPLWILVAVAIGFVGLQFLVGPYIIQWVMTIHWINLDDPTDKLLWELPDESNAFIKKLCADRHLKRPLIGVIQSGTPNAFSFGHTPADARVVVTTGLIQILTPDELNAVLAHEIGHIEHWDFAVMTLAAVVPLLLYQMYALLRHDRHGRPIAYGAYAAYIVSQFIVLTLNRTREYFADHYSSDVTRHPGDLSSALVKIACGLVASEGEYQRVMSERKSNRKAARRDHRMAGALAVMGISNVRSGASLALGGADPAAAARVMRWDLVNPWARLYELNSTHPLTALRVKALNAESEALHQSPRFPFATEARVSWGMFPLEVLLWAAPVVVGIAGIALGFSSSWLAKLGIKTPDGLWAPALLFIGITWTLRILYRYRGEMEPQAIGRLMEDVDVSEMRPRAVTLQGEILGRGIPGAFWSADLVVRDATGLLFVKYRQSIPFARLFFALSSAEDLTGQQVTIDGWFRRGMRPYIEMSRLTTSQGLTYRAYSRWIQLAAAAACTVIGAFGVRG